MSERVRAAALEVLGVLLLGISAVAADRGHSVLGGALVGGAITAVLTAAVFIAMADARG